MVSLQFLYAEQAALVALGGGRTQSQFVLTRTDSAGLSIAAYRQAMADANFWLSWGKALDLVVLQIEGLLGKPLPPPGGQFPINGKAG
jgi:hypothetical protein